MSALQPLSVPSLLKPGPSHHHLSPGSLLPSLWLSLPHPFAPLSVVSMQQPGESKWISAHAFLLLLSFQWFPISFKIKSKQDPIPSLSNLYPTVGALLHSSPAISTSLGFLSMPSTSLPRGLCTCCLPVMLFLQIPAWLPPLFIQVWPQCHHSREAFDFPLKEHPHRFLSPQAAFFFPL